MINFQTTGDWENKDFAATKYKFDKNARLYVNAMEGLTWLRDNLPSMLALTSRPRPDYVIHTDASSTGLGCCDTELGISAGGRWAERGENLSHKLPWTKGYFIWAVQFVSTHVRVITDNTTAMVCFNKQWSTRSRDCNEITSGICDFARVTHVVKCSILSWCGKCCSRWSVYSIKCSNWVESETGYCRSDTWRFQKAFSWSLCNKIEFQNPMLLCMATKPKYRLYW